MSLVHGGVLGRVHPETGARESVRDLDPLVRGPADLEAVRWPCESGGSEALLRPVEQRAIVEAPFLRELIET